MTGETDAIAPGSFRFVKRHIGIVQHFLKDLPIRPESHPNRDRGIDPHVLEIHRDHRDLRTYPFAHLQKVLRSKRLHDNEFFATQPRNMRGVVEAIAYDGRTCRSPI
ncbi:hypothetical protein P3T31_001430 [Rhizobium sp. AN70]|nr:hypothetical protein [Rhizobium sp. AN70]